MSSSLHVSANQWRTSILKACIGANVARGVAEDIADAGLALLANGNDPLPSLLTCLQAFDAPAQEASWPRSGSTADLGQLQVLHHGPSAIDLVQAGIQTQFSPDSHALVLGLAQARCHSHGLCTQVAFDDGEWIPLDQAISRSADQTSGSPIQLRSAGIEEPKSLSATHLPQPKREDWQALQGFADQILVPADATSREDAGVGDGQTDND